MTAGESLLEALDALAIVQSHLAAAADQLEDLEKHAASELVADSGDLQRRLTNMVRFVRCSTK